MRQATAQLRELSRSFFAQEAKKSRSPASLADAMESVCRQLHGRLDPLIGAGGFRALLTRALHLSKKEFPWLDHVKVEEQHACSMKGLREAVKGLDGSVISESFALVLANVIWLLVTFIGEDIVLGLVYEVWPEVGAAASRSAEEGRGR